MLSESIGEGLDDGVAASGSQGRHVEDTADGFSSAADGAFALVLSAVTIEGSQADEGGDLLAVEFAQFGDIGDEGGGSDAAESWDRLYELGFLAPVVIGLDELLDAVDLAFEYLEDGLDALSGRFDVSRLETVGLHGPQVDELSSASDELLDFGLFFRGLLGGRRLGLLGKEGQDTGIEAVGLGDQAEAASEIADPAGIDDGHVVAGVEELSDELPLVAAGGFEDDAAARRLREERLELLMSGGVVGQGMSLTGGEEVEIERGFGNVDSDPSEVRAIHGVVPFLPMRARTTRGLATAPATVRAGFQSPAAIQLCDGVLSTESRSICRRFFRGWLRSQPRNREH